MRFLIFDAGPLISLTLSGMLDILKGLKETTKDIEFIITPQVKKEVVDRAMTIKKYELEAVKIADLIDKKVLISSSEFVKDEELVKETSRVLELSKNILSARQEKISLVQEGEASCLAFSKLCKSESLVVIDERTTRLISESLLNLQSLMEKKLHMRLDIHEKNLSYFEEFNFIRSSELAFIAFKKNLIPLKKSEVTLDAVLYSLKYHGTAISSKEIEEMKVLAKN